MQQALAWLDLQYLRYLLTEDDMFYVILSCVGGVCEYGPVYKKPNDIMNMVTTAADDFCLC